MTTILYDNATTYNGSLVAVSTIGTNTLSSYRARIARELSPDFLASTATGADSSGNLIDGKAPLFSALALDDLWQDAWIWRPNAATTDQLRIVAQYTPNAGTLEPDSAWGTPPVAGEPYELHKIVDPVSLNGLINQALRRLFVEDEISFAPIAQVNRHDLTRLGWTWLTVPDWIRAAGYLGPGIPRDQVDPYLMPLRGNARVQAGHLWLEHQRYYFSGTETIYLTVTRPAYTLCAPGTPTTTAITNATNTVPIVITAPFHGRATNDPILVDGVQGNTGANGIWTATVIDASTISLNGSWGNGAYTSGGTLIPTFGIQQGLTLDTDICPPIVFADWVAAATLVELWREYSHLLEPLANQKLVRDRAEAAMWLSDLTSKYYRQPPKSFQPILAYGPRAAGFGPRV